MKRWFTPMLTMLSAVAAAAVLAVPASAQAPDGRGLVEFGTLTCDGIGEASLFGPRGLAASSGYLVVGDEARHVMLIQIEGTITDLDGNVVDHFSTSKGSKVPFTPFTCTQEFDEPGAHGVLTLTLGFVPPN